MHPPYLSSDFLKKTVLSWTVHILHTSGKLWDPDALQSNLSTPPEVVEFLIIVIQHCWWYTASDFHTRWYFNRPSGWYVITTQQSILLYPYLWDYDIQWQLELMWRLLSPRHSAKSFMCSAMHCLTMVICFQKCLVGSFIAFYKHNGPKLHKIGQLCL